MIAALISFVLGGLSLVATVPRIFPVVGLACGLAALVKSTKQKDKDKIVIAISIIGTVLNGLVILLFLIHIYLIK